MNLVYGRQFAWAWMKEHWAELFEKFGTGGSFTLPRLVSYSTKTLATAAEAVRRPAPRPPPPLTLTTTAAAANAAATAATALPCLPAVP